MRSFDGPGSYYGSGIDTDTREVEFVCNNCHFEGTVEAYGNYIECPDCELERGV